MRTQYITPELRHDMIMLPERKALIAYHRRTEAFWYAAGREDEIGERDEPRPWPDALEFAAFAMAEAIAFQAEHTVALASVHDQYKRYMRGWAPITRTEKD